MAPTFLQVSFGLSAVFAAISTVLAESHTVTFDNRCGRGTPTLILNGQVVSTGQPYTHNGVLNGIAYLQTGECQFNGEKCTLMEMNLGNPTCPGCGSSVDISLIEPHAFNVETSFAYYNGCNGQGRDCASSNCNTAFFNPQDWQVQVQCEANDVDLLITFCGDATKLGAPAAAPAKPATSAAPAPVKPTTSAAPAKPSTSEAAPAQPKPTTAVPASPVPSSSAAAAPAPSTVVNVGAAAPSESASSSAAAPAKTGSSRCPNKRKRGNGSSLVKKAEESQAQKRALAHHAVRAHSH